MTTDGVPILQVENLRVYYWTARGPIKAVDDVSFVINRNERFGFIGESGCGKTTTIMAVLRLIRKPGKIESGRILLNGYDIANIGKEEMRQTRWNKISLIPQGAMNSLNPIMRVYDQIADAITTHKGKLPEAVLRSAINDMLEMVELPARVANMYPHELSGGMKQRVCIAMATALDPDLIIADEPTSALDVVVQKAVMQTLIGVQERLGASMILIGHDMGLTAQVLDRVGVMYAGKLVEVAPIGELFHSSKHPYTQALINSLPSVREKKRGGGIPGLPPFLLNPAPGCRFQPRCPHAFEPCKSITPELRPVTATDLAACHLYEQSNQTWEKTSANTPL